MADDEGNEHEEAPSQPQVDITDWFNEHGGRIVLLAVIASVITAIALGIAHWTWLTAGGASNATVVRNLTLAAAIPPSAVLALWRASVAQRQANTTRLGLNNERYQKGVELLASESMMIRIGGIHALQNLALESPREHSNQIVQLLCAFVRHPPSDRHWVDEQPAGASALGDSGPERSSGSRSIREDVLASIRAAANCAEKAAQAIPELKVQLDLRGVDLRGCDLSRLYFRGALLTNARLQRSDLQQANLSDANLSYAKLENADLTLSSLEGALLDHASFNGACLEQANLNRARSERGQWVRARLSHAQLRDFRGLLVDMSYSQPHYADLTRAKLRSSNLQHADFEKAILVHADLTASDAREARFYGAEFESAYLGGIDAHGAFFSHASFQNATLSSATLTDCVLSDANLNRTRANHIRLTKSVLERCELTRTDLRNAWFHGCMLRDARFDKTILTGAKMGASGLASQEFFGSPEEAAVQGLTQHQLDSSLAAAHFPPELDGAIDVETREPLVWRGGVPD